MKGVLPVCLGGDCDGGGGGEVLHSSGKGVWWILQGEGERRKMSECGGVVHELYLTLFSLYLVFLSSLLTPSLPCLRFSSFITPVVYFSALFTQLPLPGSRLLLLLRPFYLLLKIRAREMKSPSSLVLIISLLTLRTSDSSKKKKKHTHSHT